MNILPSDNRAKLIIIYALAFALIALTLAATVLIVQHRQPPQELRELLIFFYGGLLGLLGHTEAEKTNQPVTVTNTPADPVPTSDTPATPAAPGDHDND